MNDLKIGVCNVSATPAISRRQWLSLALLLTGTFVTVLDNFIVLVAVPVIRVKLGASFADAEFIVASYTLTYAVGMITSGRLGDRYGRRRMLVIGFAIFTLASALCGLAPSPRILIASRVLQGMGAAILAPQVLAIIRVTFPLRQQRASALAAFGIVTGLASVIGGVLGGAIISADLAGLSWRPIFLLNIPVGIVAVIAIPAVLDESAPSSRNRLDMVGAFLSAAGLWLLLYPLIEGREQHWPAWVWAMLTASAATLAIFGLHQRAKTRRRAAPLLDTGLFRIRAFTVGLGLTLLFFGTLSPFFLCYTYLVQSGFGKSPGDAGLYFAPLPAAFALASFVAGRLARHDARRVLLAGAVCVMLGSFSAYGAATWITHLTPVGLILPLVILGFGQGLFSTPVMNVVLSGVPDEHAGAASGVLTTMQRTGNALGVAILQIPFFATLNRDLASGIGKTAAYTSAFASVASCVCLLAAGVLGLLLMLPRQQSGAREA